MNVAIVDLGTNTFNCCVVSIAGTNFQKLLDFNEFPRLGEGGVAYGFISSEAMQRGIESLATIKKRIEPYNCETIKLIGTSALRNAKNAQDFCSLAKEKFNFDIEIIQGEQEAEYIFLGNNLAFDWHNKTALILDIGGGSNECIICQHNKILWKHSFECGMQRIVSQFGLTHPTTKQTKQNIWNYLEENFSLLTEKIATYHIDMLIGSSGAFDVFRSIYFAQNELSKTDTAAEEIPISQFKDIVNYLADHTLDEIHAMRGMDLDRAPLLPIAGLIADFVVTRYNISKLMQSSYSLKEGVIHKLMNY